MSTELQQTIANGSKSFYLASVFFSRPTKLASWILYRWCRYCDDLIDNGGKSADLKHLREVTLKGLRGEKVEPIYLQLGQVCAEHGIPETYPLELLNGFERDTGLVRLETLDDVEGYAYQVAGVVGLMMAHIMRVDVSRAGQAAVSLGNAMQLTNIARDVREDFERERIYLPLRWLEDAGVDTTRLTDPAQGAQVFSVVAKLLARADELYAEGYQGLAYIPLRSAFAVSIAGSIYSAIGRKIMKRGPSALQNRIHVSLPEKIWLAAEGVYRVLRRAPERFAIRRLHANAS